MVNNLKTGPNGLALVRSEEGTIYHLYNDIAHNCTVGTGHLVHMGPISGAATEAPYVHGCTAAQELALLQHDLSYAEHTVNFHVTVVLNQNEFDALVDFTFNEGSGTFQRSTLLELLNAGKKSALPAEFAKYNEAGGKVSKDLTDRREHEVTLFQKPV